MTCESVPKALVQFRGTSGIARHYDSVMYLFASMMTLYIQWLITIVCPWVS